MKMLAWLTVTYALTSTIALLVLQFRLTRSSGFSKDLLDLRLGDLKPMDKLEALVKISEIRKGEIPWYERSISTIGVIAFFSMLLATGIQTTRAGIDETRSERLKVELQQLEKHRSELETLVGRVSRAVLEEYQKRGVIDEGARELLQFRLRSLEGMKSKP